MKKVLISELEDAIFGVLESEAENDEKASAIVSLIRGVQDANGVKLCMNVSPTDVAYQEV